MAVDLQGMVRAQVLDMVCPLVKEHGKSIIQDNYIASLPRTLVLQLMRFNSQGRKIKTLVNFPTGAWVFPYTSDDQASVQSGPACHPFA